MFRSEFRVEGTGLLLFRLGHGPLGVVSQFMSIRVHGLRETPENLTTSEEAPADNLVWEWRVASSLQPQQGMVWIARSSFHHGAQGKSLDARCSATHAAPSQHIFPAAAWQRCPT